MVPRRQLSSTDQYLLEFRRGRLTRVDIFSTPTMTITIGNTQAGTEEGKLDHPHPFHPIRARTLSDMIAEQQSWTIPVIAKPNFECTLVAKLT
jgi:hypothetical protein